MNPQWNTVEQTYTVRHRRTLLDWLLFRPGRVYQITINFEFSSSVDVRDVSIIIKGVSVIDQRLTGKTLTAT